MLNKVKIRKNGVQLPKLKLLHFVVIKIAKIKIKVLKLKKNKINYVYFVQLKGLQEQSQDYQ